MILVQKSKSFDVLLLSLLVVFITFHPYYLHGEINLFELGIYLPGINAVLDGLVPYRDFFHLRGPMELYIPALFMRLFGRHVGVLTTYFYAGTVLTLMMGILIGKEIYKTRFVLYLMVPVLVARTFPRVAFTFWGGLRYGFGLLALLFAVYAFKHKRGIWIFLSGIISGLALLTSVEVGACSILSVLAACAVGLFFWVHPRPVMWKWILSYIFGLAAILFPYGLYLLWTGSWVPYADSVYSVIHVMANVFPDSSFAEHPQGLLQAVAAMNPLSPHFKHLTPAYCYLFFGVYLAVKKRKKGFTDEDLPVVLIAFYGFAMYISAFRKLGASQFEMALQPEKILLFFLLERAFSFFWRKRAQYKEWLPTLREAGARMTNRVSVWGIDFLVLAFVMSSLGYAVARYNHRFFAFQYIKNLALGKDTEKLIPLSGEKPERLTIGRVKGFVVPSWQADDIKGVVNVIGKNTSPEEPVFMFPELGAYHFIVERPFVGRFPMATFSWFGGWHEELFGDLEKTKPRFAVLSKDPGPFFEKVYFRVPENEKYYKKVMDYIERNYTVVSSTHSLLIYRRKDPIQGS